VGTLFKTEKYLNHFIEEFNRVNETALNFNPVDWIDLYNHCDTRQIPPQKGTHPHNNDDSHARNNDRHMRNDCRRPNQTVTNVDVGNHHEKNANAASLAHRATPGTIAQQDPVVSWTNPPRGNHQPSRAHRTSAYATCSTKRTPPPSSSLVRESHATATTTRLSETENSMKLTKRPCARTCNKWKVNSLKKP
jgi:hypothetical protein